MVLTNVAVLLVQGIRTTWDIFRAFEDVRSVLLRLGDLHGTEPKKER